MPSRRNVLTGGGAALAGTLAGCIGSEIAQDAGREFVWPMARADPASTGSTDDAGPVSEPTIRWQSDHEEDFAGYAPPVVTGDRVLAIGRNILSVMERATGELRFDREGSFRSGPTLARADAYRSDVVCTRSQNGHRGLAADGGYDLGGVTVAFDRWHAPGGRPSTYVHGGPRPSTTVAADGMLYAPSPDESSLYALNANSGAVEWSTRLTADVHPAPNRPAVRNGTVYATGPIGTVTALDAETGDREWETDLEPLVDDERQYLATNAPTVTDAGLIVPGERAVDLRALEDGSRLWRYVHDGSAEDGSAAVANGLVVVADGEESLHGIDLETGDQRWTVEYELDIDPVIADGVVYLAYTWLPELHAFDAETGDHLWDREVPSGPSQPVVVDGVLYLATFDGVLALEEP
ncbi:hypothetical protein HALLA_04070 (plasmid) [Halostagnicola larsenii XH-48]|uniref:Pyrrolo-quinoline quinone repeat domain-containing protein n=1 Tax=Halostagnicola larsenii XH-48 TaxID=797299 RepID=W0JSB4_9EURY|nr:PQQ-binding-like beta-propeller repeat protein [Halostagnicola larsenii]AHG01581.1 hypothetical protein HALLA_04070 [Halostagnicola larsenii XH-48]